MFAGWHDVLPVCRDGKLQWSVLWRPTVHWQRLL